tara:strand:- start:432 stop:668 length:237 start_codon:yes stop_codon:yes gene_type:complete
MQNTVQKTTNGMAATCALAGIVAQNPALCSVKLSESKFRYLGHLPTEIGVAPEEIVVTAQKRQHQLPGNAASTGNGLS